MIAVPPQELDLVEPGARFPQLMKTGDKPAITSRNGHGKSYRQQDLFPIPDGLILKPRILQGQIKFFDCPPQVLVDLYKDGCAEFFGLVCGVIIWMDSGASFKELSHIAERDHINYVAYCLQRSRCAHRYR